MLTARQRLLLYTFATAAIPICVSAGQLGPTSRGSATISVNIPARLDAQVLHASHASGTPERGLHARFLCVVSYNSRLSYGVELLHSSMTATDAATPIAMGSEMSVGWADEHGRVRKAQLVPGEMLRGFRASLPGSCSTENSGGKLILEAQQGVHPSSTAHRSALTLMISPD